MSRGCPQGSVLGPLLWLVLAQSFLSKASPLLSDRVSIFAYADDFAFTISGATSTEIAQNFIPIAKTFESWLQENDLKISTSKSTHTIIQRIRNKTYPIDSPLHLSIQGHTIPHSDTFTFLGLTFNNRLTWKDHILTLKRKTLAIHQRWRIIQSNTWGAHSNLLKIWYLTVIEKTMTYAAGIWAGSLNKKLNIAISSLQRPFLRSITRAYATTSTAALNVLAGLPPLHQVLKKEAQLATLLRLQGETTIQNTLYNSTQIQTKTRTLLIHPTQLQFPHVSTTRTKISTNTVIYTDGSRSEKGTGAAFAVFTDNQLEHCQQFHFHHYNTIYQAEAQAILEATVWATDNNLHKTTIVSDSLSVIQAIQAHIQRDPLIISIQQQLIHSHQQNKQIYIQWTKAHVGNIGNETADQLAKAAAEDDSLPVTQLRIPPSHIKDQLQEALLTDWQCDWENNTTGRFTYNFLPKVSQKRLISTPWHTTFLTNHGPFPAYLARFNLAATDLCACGSTGNSTHYLHHCDLTKDWHIPPPRTTNTWLARLYYHKPTARKLRELYYWLTKNSNLITAAIP